MFLRGFVFYLVPMSDLKAKIKNQMVQSMKARDAARTQALRMAISVIQKKEIDEGKDLDDNAVLKTLQTMLKQLTETLEQAKSLGRTEIVSATEFEMGVVKEFLPKMLTEAEVKNIVSEIVTELKSSGKFPENAGAAMGAVMKATMAKVGAQSDGKTIQSAVKSALGT